MFHNEWDLASLTDEFAEWLAASIRSAFAVSAAGFRDDNKAIQRPWGFDLADALRVAIWHGNRDDEVPLAHGQWLADRITGSELHVLPNEGHASIGRRFPEILEDLVQRASR